jgi:hypothetical protein
VTSYWQQDLFPGGVLARPWRVRHGRIKVGHVPTAEYGAEITIARSDVEAGPVGGRLHGYRPFVVAPSTGVVQLPVTLVETMRTTRPRPGDVASPLAIAWEPIPGATRYEAALIPDDDAATASDVDPHAVVVIPEWHVEVPLGTWGIQLRAIGENDEVLGELSERRYFLVWPPEMLPFPR